MPQFFPLLNELLIRLEAEGFEIGIGKHIQLQELLKHLPEDLEPEDLRPFLSPLFAQNAAQQQRFGILFKEAVEAAHALRDVPQNPESQPLVNPKKPEFWRWLVGIALGLAVLLVFIFTRTSQDPPCENTLFPSPIQKQVYVSDSLPFCDLLPAANSLNAILLGTWEWNGPVLSDSAQQIALSRLQFLPNDSTNSCLLFGAPDSVGEFSYLFPLQIEECPDTLYLNISVIEQVSIQSEADSTDLAPGEPARFDTLPHPYPRPLSDLLPSLAAQQQQEFLDTHQWWVKILAIGLLLMALWSYLTARRRKRQEAVARREARNQPPFVWRMPFDKMPRISLGEGTQRLMSQFRRRGRGELLSLDMPRTVRSTVQKGGQLTLSHRNLPQSVDYLLLIRRRSHRDHRAQYYNQLYTLLKAQEVHIERFYYTNDPRSVWNEQYPQGMSLQSLNQRYGHHRLILLSEGREFLNPRRGNLTRWSRMLLHWPQRVLLSPKAWNRWGSPEQRLEGRFPVIPASADSLSLMLQAWNEREDLPNSWEQKVEDALEVPILEGREGMALLPKALQAWVATCAIWPSLQWELTLYLGSIVESWLDSEVLHTKSLQQLSRIPCFVEGKMTESLRESLLDDLETRHPGLELEIRRRLHELFEAGELEAPSPDSAAFEDYALNLVINELHVTQNKARRRELLRKLSEMIDAGAEPDWVVLKRLEKPQEGRDVVLPPSFKKRAEAETSEADSLHRDRQLIQWLALILLSIFLPLRFSLQCFQGDLQSLNGQEYCLTDLADSLTFYQHWVDQDIRSEDLAQAEGRLAEMQSWAGIGIEDSLRSVPYENGHFEEVFTNVSAQFLNQGVRMLDSLPDFSPSVFLFALKTVSDSSLLRFCDLYFPLAEKYLPATQNLFWYLGKMENSLLQQTCTGCSFWKDREGSLDSLALLAFEEVEDSSTRSILPIDVPEAPVQEDSLFSIQVNGQLVFPGGNFVEPVRLTLGNKQMAVGQDPFSFNLTANTSQDTLRFPLQLNEDAYEDIQLSLKIPRDSIVGNRYQLPPIVLSPRSSLPTVPLLPEMVSVAGGRFLMGSPESEDGRYDNEVQHFVSLRSYDIATTEVTNAEYVRFLNDNADRTDSLSVWIEIGSQYLRIQEGGEGFVVEAGYEQHPVVVVSWYGAQAYCHWLNRRQAGGRRGWQLPSEAQWEYAAAGGAKGYDAQGNRRQIWAGTSHEDSLSFYAWYSRNTPEEQRVGAKQQNLLGLYDMSGNVDEWCADWYGTYPSSELSNPRGPDTGEGIA